MNAAGQIVLTRAVPDWSPFVDAAETTRLRDAGVETLHAVTGLIEFPLFTNGLPQDKLYLYSVEGPKLSTLARLLTRFEAWVPEMTALKRLADFPESPFAASCILSPLGRPASRTGWGAFRISGYVTQGEDPNVFPAIFYEVSLDTAGGTTVFLPTSSPRHYEHIDLETASLRDLQAAPIWGFEEEPFGLTEDTEKEDVS